MTASTLLGRKRELHAIDGVLDAVVRGQRRVLLVTGEPGIGKSRLGDALCERAEARDFACAWGRAWEAGGAPAFWPWPALLRALEKKRGTFADSELIARLSDPQERNSSSLGPSADRFALFDRVARTLESACAHGPLALVLDDVHAADVASLGLFEFVSRQLRDVPLLLVATYREVEASELAEVDAALGRVRREAEVLRLGALSEEAVRDLIVQSGLHATSEETLHRVCDITGGSPLFVLEVVRVLEANPSALGDSFTSADGLRSAIREHLRHVSPETIGTLGIAAVIGREFLTTALCELAQQSAEDLVPRLLEATRKGVISPAGADRHRFVHVLLRDTLHADLQLATRAALHARYASWLAEAPSYPRYTNPSEIAHHWLLAGPTHVLEAAAATQRAAEHASRMLAFEHAVELCTRALEALDLARCSAPELRFELLILLGISRVHSGNTPAGKAACQNAAAIAEQLQSPELLARAALGYGTAFVFGQVDPVLVSLCEKSLATLPSDALELRARVLARHAAALQPNSDVQLPVRIAREALSSAERLGDPLAKLSISFAAMSALMDIIDPRERRRLNQQILQTANQLGEVAMALHTQRRLIIDHLDLGEFARATLLIDEYAEASRTLSQPHMRWQLPMLRAAVALAQGRFAEHAEHVAEAKQIAIEVAGMDQTVFALHMLASAYTRDDVAGHQLALREVSKHMPPLPYYNSAIEAHGATLRGDLAQARAILDQWSPESAAKHGDRLMSAFETETVLALRDLAWARVIRAELEPAAHESCSWGLVGYAIIGPVTRPLFLLDGLLGDWPQAERHFQSALAWCDNVPSPPLRCRILIEWAELLSGRDDPALASQIVEHVRHGKALAQEYGLRGLFERASRLLDSSDEPHVAAAELAPCRLTREGDVWRLTGCGLECRVRDSRGIAFLARLLDAPNRELHVLELVGAPEEVRRERAEPAIDERARGAYRARVSELREELENAESFRDLGRAEQLREELERISTELAHSLGLGGRIRTTSAAAERARVNVQRRIADSVTRIRAQNPALADHIAACLRTGLFCSYEPGRAQRGIS